MWFVLVYIAGAHSMPAQDISLSMMQKHYASQAECLDDARDRVSGISRIGEHGRYMCMYHGEPDREMSHAPKWSF